MGAATPSSEDSGVVPIGSVLDGRYRVDAVIGKGGMGRVYRGEHMGIGRVVAIKVLHAQLGRSKEASARFQREALASGRLDHPNIVGVSDFGVLADGSLYLVMEMLEGEPLGMRLERDKRIVWPEALQIMRGVLTGLRHAHDRGVVHRDIKPDNVFLARKDGEQIVKILDFGIAKLFAGNVDDPATTRAGLTVGTPAYLSPEQAVGGAITPASDLYSASVVLYEMIVGRVPFDEQDPLAMLTAHVSRDAPTFQEVAPGIDVPPALEELIRHRGLAKVSAERIATAMDYQKSLDAIMRGAGYEAAIPRASSSLAIPVGPHSGNVGIVTPSPGFLATPMPFAAEIGTAPTASMPPVGSEPVRAGVPRASSRYSGSAPVPVPRNWVKIGGIVLVLVVLAAIALLAFGRRHKGDDGSPSQPAGLPGIDSPLDHDTRLKAALRDLEAGASCAERKAAIPKLVELGDDRAITPLKKARFRGVGGVLGIGESNSNSCLKADAEAAIKALGGK